MNILSRIHSKLGDLWWYTFLLFFVQRVADVINMVVGLWLVPKYVPQSELGAVMPLAQFANFIGIPLAIVAIPFMKYLNVFAERHEYGKVKSLLRDVFAGTMGMMVLTLLIAWLTIPFFFERMRVAQGSLGLLVVAVSLIGAVSTIFQNAVQGLKLYSSIVWFGLLAAPVRLAVMVVAMPFRAISGYFVGQGAAGSVPVVGALWALRKRLGASVKAEPYLHEYGREMLRYTIPVAILTIASTIYVSVEMLVIRHRLSEFESAGYYIISTFSMIASYLGAAFVTFLFPMVAGAEARGEDSLRTLKHAIVGTLGAGGLISLAFLVFGKFILGLTPVWKTYQGLSFEMFLLCVYNVLTAVVNCLTTYEVAQGRFRFLRYFLPVFTVKMILTYCLTGYTFFNGLVPDRWLAVLSDFNPNRLKVLLIIFIGFHLLIIPIFLIDVLGKYHIRKRSHETGK